MVRATKDAKLVIIDNLMQVRASLLERLAEINGALAEVGGSHVVSSRAVKTVGPKSYTKVPRLHRTKAPAYVQRIVDVAKKNGGKVTAADFTKLGITQWSGNVMETVSRHIGKAFVTTGRGPARQYHIEGLAK